MSDEFREGDGGASGGHGALGSDHGLPQTRDFADTLSPTPFEVSSIRSSPVDSPNIIDHPSPHVQYSLNVDTSPPEPPNRADTQTPFSPSLRRRATRAATFRTVSDFEDFSERPGWHPGAEPGVDPSKPDGGRSSMTTLRAPCEITVVDFSEDNFSMQRLDNDSLNVFMRLPTPGWVKCRWINVNRLSWDVIQALGTHKNLHRLAIEDIMNTRNRTKVEWYPSHAFIVLTLQKLVRRYDSESEDSDSDSDDDATSRTSKRSSVSGRTRKRFKRLLRRLKKTFQGNGRDASDSSGLELGSGPYRERGTDEEEDKEGIESRSTGLSDISEPEYRTLQGYHASPNLAWTKYMENNSALGSKNLDVGCEQVSMFITNDNSIISFFEQSAQDIEEPIVRRLQTVDTITRQSCDASMVAHAILDAIIDLAMPVTMCYSDVIDDIELDVLNRPDISQTKHLYIVVSEINKMLSFISPITTLIQALREHTVDVPLDAAMRTILDPQHPAIITSQTYMYLGDVLDHCVLITDTLNKLKGSADGMINLIFNTISANQNESMKQLTIATIIFLPLTFITGYFGQNFEPFGMLNQGIGVFWKISVPVVLFTIAVLLREPIYDYCRAILQRRHISDLRSRSTRRRRRKRS